MECNECKRGKCYINCAIDLAYSDSVLCYGRKDLDMTPHWKPSNINGVHWHDLKVKEPPNNLRILTVNMNSSTPMFIDNIFQSDNTFLIGKHEPTHWTQSLNFPIM